MTEQELKQLLALGYELPGLEFKPPGPRSDAYLFATVTRAVLGMANRSDGGLVVIGIEEDAGGIRPVGVSAPDLDSWNCDDVMAGLSPAADPFVSVSLERVTADEKTFVVLSVAEFETVPVICKRQFNDPRNPSKQVLRPGACYVRPRRKPETSEIPSQTEMRELLELAVRKGIRDFLQRAAAAGLPVAAQASPSVTERFDAELEDFK
jgi:predicted HTH transcriptional regulator